MAESLAGGVFGNGDSYIPGTQSVNGLLKAWLVALMEV